jgi:predicted DsbA family dithiol-disulfide isomerase
VLHLAADRGCQEQVCERLMATYFCEGGAIGDRATLAAAAAQAGLDRDEVAAMLQRDDYAAEVRRDEQEAAVIGISGVPFFVIDRRYGLSGAHPADALVQVFEQAWAERAA